MPTLAGKTVLITGATDGLGKAVAHRVAASGASLIVHGRNQQKGDRLLEELKTETGNQNIFYYNADFSSLQAVVELGDAVLANHTSLHVLLNNAAIGGGPKGPSKRELSRDGYELRFAVNYLAHFLLTQKLLPLIIRSAPAGIVNVSSIGQSPLDFNDIHLEKRYDSFDAYCKSKLAQIMFGFELAEKLNQTGVTVNSLHPSTLMDTNMVRHFFGSVTSSVEDGVEAVMHVAFAEETGNINGAYFNRLTEARAHTQAYDAAARKRLWELSEDLTPGFSPAKL